MARIVALLVLLVVTTVAFGYPTIRVGNEEFEAVPVRVVRAAEPDPHHHKKGKHGFGGGYGGYGGHGGYGGYDGYGGNGGFGGFNGGYGGGPGFGGYGGYPQGGGNSHAQSSANAASFNTPFGSASFASSNANAGAESYGR